MSTEFTTVSSSSFDPAALAAKLTEKSAEGWTVVSIVSTGGDVTAFLSKVGSGSTSTSSSTSSFESTSSSMSSEREPAAYETVVSSSEPAGWASAPATSAPEPEPAYSSAPSTVSSSESAYAPAPEPAYTPAPEPAYTPSPSPSPSVPAGWYADPAGRFELRYWDGGTWTEHVSRAGQQYTDPPVA